MGISSKPPRRKREKREVSGMTALIAAKPAKRSALLRLPHRIYFILDFAKMKAPQDTYEAGPNGNEVLGPNPGTNILTTNHIYIDKYGSLSTNQLNGMSQRFWRPRKWIEYGQKGWWDVFGLLSLVLFCNAGYLVTRKPSESLIKNERSSM